VAASHGGSGTRPDTRAALTLATRDVAGPQTATAGAGSGGGETAPRTPVKAGRP
jgi:hypothetical protein